MTRPVPMRVVPRWPIRPLERRTALLAPDIERQLDLSAAHAIAGGQRDRNLCPILTRLR